MRSLNHFLFLGIILTTSATASVAQEGVSSVFTAGHDTAVPGSLLTSGTYTIQVVDHLTDRSVIQIKSAGKPDVTFLAVKSNHGTGEPGNGPIAWDKKINGVEALRGFNFPTGEHLDFVYPKNDAVTLANANHEVVVAVDPVSENRPELSKLSPSDLQLVNLWSLTPVKIGPASASTNGIEAKKYSVQPGPGAPTSAPSAVATASESPVRTTPPTVVAELHQPRLDAEPAPRKAVVKRLPQTASYVPLLGLLSVVFFGSALWLRHRGQPAV